MTIHDMLCLRLYGQHLTAPDEPLTVAADLCGLQAQFLNSAIHALRIRSTVPSVDGLVKSWTLRSTVHLFPESDLPLYLRRHGTPDDVCESGWYQWTQERAGADGLLPPERERFFARLMADSIARGIDTREALRQVCRDQGMTEQEEAHLFHGWGGIIAEMAQMGVLCFKVQQEKAYRLCPPFTPMTEEAAHAELARRYFTHYGPATLRDAAYFFHASQKDIKAWMDGLPIEDFTCDGRTYFHIPTAADVPDIPDCVFLAGFDQLMLGYRKEDNPFLPSEHLRGIFNLAGIVAPAVLLHGRVVGKWKAVGDRADVTLFEKVGKRDQRSIEREAKRWWKQGARFVE